MVVVVVVVVVVVLVGLIVVVVVVCVSAVIGRSSLCSISDNSFFVCNGLSEGATIFSKDLPRRLLVITCMRGQEQKMK